MFCRGLLNFRSGSFGGWGMYLMIGFCLLMFLTLIFFAFKLIKAHSHSKSSESSDSALNILNERYARGEISDEEYTKRKIILSTKN
ncbi:SHOCT domain-containing protein [Clostridium vincentii]|uniref:SHOCT domain-containing protein n=1 Tax=Clostridium vincentii TaxID=52704 RepID=A0A2T0BCU7_9CLOT|nr:SHOCT domain-containing protein [Clostridium vincentii]PRR81704.1 hypothetical protein CLVI_23130 [Clostridium vincentii]